MKRRSPTLEGFQVMFRLPVLGLAEIAWRWSFGLGAMGYFFFPPPAARFDRAGPRADLPGKRAPRRRSAGSAHAGPPPGMDRASIARPCSYAQDTARILP